MKGDDKADIEADANSVRSVGYVGAKMYAEQAEAGAGEAAADDDLGDAVDAEFEEVKEDDDFKS